MTVDENWCLGDPSTNIPTKRHFDQNEGSADKPSAVTVLCLTRMADVVDVVYVNIVT
jgi:hypothetical protein